MLQYTHLTKMGKIRIFLNVTATCSSTAFVHAKSRDSGALCPCARSCICGSIPLEEWRAVSGAHMPRSNQVSGERGEKLHLHARLLARIHAGMNAGTHACANSKNKAYAPSV